MKLTSIFRTDPEIRENKMMIRINKLLFKFFTSPDIIDQVSYNKTFRTQTFWENTETIIPIMFSTWLKNRGYSVTEENGCYLLKNCTFHWKMREYKFEDYKNYYIGYQILLNSKKKNSKFSRRVVYEFVVEINNNFPQHLHCLNYNKKKDHYCISGKYGEDEVLPDFEEGTIRGYFQDQLRLRKEMERDSYLLRTGLAQYNEILVMARQFAEQEFRRIAEKYLEEMAKKGIPVIGVPFKKKLDDHAHNLTENYLDDYDLNTFSTDRIQLGIAINTAKNKIINQYIKS